MILSWGKNLEIPTKTDCPLINFNARIGLWFLQIKNFGLRQLNSHRWVGIPIKTKRESLMFGIVAV